MDGTDKRMLEREALRNVIQQWNMNRLDIFELSEPNEDLSFHGVMRFYFQDSGQKVATKCIRVASDATVSDVIETLIEKFRPDMRMLSVASYALYELHSQEERKLANDEKPLLVQLNWHLDDREGRFLLKNVDDKTVSAVRGGTDTTNTNFKRKLSKREKKELKKKEKLSRMKSDALKNDKNPVAEKLYTELPETSFTRSISNPEAVMRRRRQQKERKLLQFRSKDGGPDTGGTLKVYGESLCSDVPYKTLLLSINDCSSNIVREMLEKYGLGKTDPQLYCLVQVNTLDNSEYILDDDECPLAIVMSHNQRGSIMFHVRRRPADCQPRRRKKKSGSIRAGGNANSMSGIPAGVLVELQSDGSQMDNGRTVCISSEVVEVGSANGVALQLYGPSIQPRHCVLGANEGVVTLTPLHTDAHTYVNGQRIHHTTILQHGCIIKFDRISTFRFVDPTQENKLNRQISQSQNFDSASMYDRSPTSPAPDNNSGLMSPISQLGHDTIQSMEPNTTGEPDSDFRRAVSPINKMGSQDNFPMSYNYKNHMDTPEQMANYTNNNNIMKMDNEALMLSQHLANSKSDLLQENHFASPYNAQQSMMNSEQSSQSKVASGQYKDNYETTFDLDGNVETKSICSAKSGGSGHENRVQKGQEAILPAVLEFPEHTQHVFLQNVITRLDVNIPAFKLAPVYTLYLCARYRASTHYRPELTPTERAHKLTTLLHHIASLIQDVVQEKYSDATLQAFWMANSSELLHFLKCDRHISAFTVQAQDILSNTVQAAFSNLVGCFHMELSQVLTSFLEDGPSEDETSGVIISVLNNAMALLRRCRVNAALTIQLFSQLFHYINVWCFNKVVASPHMMCNVWGALISARLSPVGAWAERQGLEIAADCHLALIHQCAHLLQAPKNTPEDIANMTSSCFKLNSVQLRCLLGGYFQETSSGVVQRLPIDLIEAAVKHAQGVADELHRADGREIVLEESSSLPLSLLIPEDGFSADVVRGLPSGLAEFLTPLQRSGFCRLAPQPHSLGHWTVYMTGYNGSSIATKPPQQPVVEMIQLQKNSNGIGLSIVAAKGAGQSKLGIYIKSVVPGGAAAADQRLQAGDQLLAVDGYSLVGITQERAAEHLVRTGPVVTLHVAKQGAVLHGLATLLRQPSPQPNRGGPRRMSERDLPSKVEMEQNPMANHMGSTVKTSKSVPALHEHTKQHEVFNPGYSRTSSNNSIPAMQNMKLKSNQGQMQQQTDQSNFYQNLSVYQNTGLGDRSSNLRNSQNNLQLHNQIPTKPPNIDNQNPAERYMANQRPQSAYYGNQPIQNHLNNPNLRAAQSTKDLVFGNENYGNSQVVKGGYPSMPNVNQGYSPSTNVNMSQPYHHQLPGQPNLGNNTISRIPMSPLSPNQYNQNYGNQGYIGNPNQMTAQQAMHGNNQMANPSRGQAKLAEMSEEVKRRHQRGVMNPQQHSDTLQQKRVQYGQDGHGYPPPPMNANIPMSPVKQQPPVAPKPNIKREIQEISQDVPEGPIPPPPSTHPMHQQAEEESGYLASSSDPPAVSFYPTHRQSGQNSQSHFPPNPWEREEREKEMEVRRNAGRAWRDQQIASLQALGEDRRTPQQEQQLRALTLERDFERRAQETQIDEDDKVRSTRNDLNIQPVGSNIVSSVQPISVAMSNTSSTDQQPDNPPSQQETRVVQPPSIPSIQPKSILKSNLKLDNLNSNSPHSPSKTQKNASFSANLTPQSLKFDNVAKYDYNVNNKMETMSASKYPEQTSSNLATYMPKYDMNNTTANQLSQSMGDLYVNSSTSYSRTDNLNSNVKFDNQDFLNSSAPPPPERGSSFAIMSQQQALRSNLSVVSQPSIMNQNNNLLVNNNTNVKDKRVSFHDKDYSSSLLTTLNSDNQDNEPIVIMREDPDRFISEAEMMLQSPTTPTGPNITHTPGVIGAQEVYRDPRQKRLAEQQKAQQAGATPIPEKLSFKEKMKMFALESGESNTPKDKVKISRAQRDIDAVH